MKRRIHWTNKSANIFWKKNKNTLQYRNEWRKRAKNEQTKMVFVKRNKCKATQSKLFWNKYRSFSHILFIRIYGCEMYCIFGRAVTETLMELYLCHHHHRAKIYSKEWIQKLLSLSLSLSFVLLFDMIVLLRSIERWKYMLHGILHVYELIVDING